MNSGIQKLGMALLIVTAHQFAYGAERQEVIVTPKANSTVEHYAKLKDDLNAPYYRPDIHLKRAVCKPTVQEHEALTAMAWQNKDLQVLTYLQLHGTRTDHPVIETSKLAARFVQDHMVGISLIVIAAVFAHEKGGKSGRAIGFDQGFKSGETTGFSAGKTVGINEGSAAGIIVGQQGRCFVEMETGKSSRKFAPCGCGQIHRVCFAVNAQVKDAIVKKCNGLWPLHEG